MTDQKHPLPWQIVPEGKAIKPNRVLSQIVSDNIHLDDFNKAIIVTGIRAKEEHVANLEQAVIDLVGNLEEALDVVCTLCKRLNPQHAGCTECMDTDHWRETIKRYS